MNFGGREPGQRRKCAENANLGSWVAQLVLLNVDGSRTYRDNNLHACMGETLSLLVTISWREIGFLICTQYNHLQMHTQSEISATGSLNLNLH